MAKEHFKILDDENKGVEVILIRDIEYENKQFSILGITEDDYIGCQVCRYFGHSCVGNGILIREINGKFLIPVEDEVKERILINMKLK